MYFSIAISGFIFPNFCQADLRKQYMIIDSNYYGLALSVRIFTEYLGTDQPQQIISTMSTISPFLLCFKSLGMVTTDKICPKIEGLTVSLLQDISCLSLTLFYTSVLPGIVGNKNTYTWSLYNYCKVNSSFTCGHTKIQLVEH